MPKTNGSGQATVLTPDQMKSLMDAAPTQAHRVSWQIMRFTGSRITETLRLTWGAMHTDRIVFVKSTTKTRTTREVRLSQTLTRELDSYRVFWRQQYGREPKARDLLFPGRGSLLEPVTRQSADKALRKALADLSLPSGVSLHTPRRSLATTMVQSGTSLMTVARFTGHASLEQLRRYVDVTPADELAALESIGG